MKKNIMEDIMQTASFLSRRVLAALAATFLLLPRPGFAKETLTPDEFSQQVAESKLGVKGALEAAAGARERSDESSLLLAPAFFAHGEFSSDEKPLPNAFFTYDRVETHAYTAGLQQQTAFGLQARLFYDWERTSYLSAQLPSVLRGFVSTYYEPRPTLELTQPLLANGFGRGVRAQKTLGEAQALSVHHLSLFQAK